MTRFSSFALIFAAFLLLYTLSCSSSTLEKENTPYKKNATYYNNAAKEMSERLGLNAESIPIFKKAISLDPKNPLYYNNISLPYWNIKRQEESIHHLNQAILMDPTYATPHYILASLTLATARYKNSISHYKNGIALFMKKLQKKPFKADIDGSAQSIQLKIALSHGNIGRAGDYLNNPEIAIIHSKAAEVLFLENKYPGYYKIARANVKALLNKYKFKSFIQASKTFKKQIITDSLDKS